MENEGYETIDLLEVLNAVRQHLLDNKIHTEDDIAKYLDLAVVGVIPEYQGGKKK